MEQRAHGVEVMPCEQQGRRPQHADQREHSGGNGIDEERDPDRYAVAGCPATDPLDQRDVIAPHERQ